jgi:hypothetical protein
MEGKEDQEEMMQSGWDGDGLGAAPFLLNNDGSLL